LIIHSPGGAIKAFDTTMKHVDNLFSPNKLYGDDFSIEKIADWYNLEKEGYANLGSRNRNNYKYQYHEINKAYAFNHLPKDMVFENALGVGSAYGDEFLPVVDQIKKITILEPSDQLFSHKLGSVEPKYVKPNIDGKLDFPNNSFDLIVCFSTLHHIPNVSFVISELHRCLKPGGYFLLHEPITSMGDWRTARKGLTQNERGIPLRYFRKILKDLNFKILKESLCLSMTSFLTRILKRRVWRSKTYIKVDRILSGILKSRAGKYHREGFFSKIAPGVVYYVLSK
jgi:SAM-dependent methyltransferase